MDRQKWMQLSLAQQLGQVGSEISRARHWEINQDRLSRDKALERALELLDLSLEDSRWRRRLKELARLREVLSDWFCYQNQYETAPEALEAYCTTFALGADRRGS